jgi:hypothetical protein
LTGVGGFPAFGAQGNAPEIAEARLWPTLRKNAAVPANNSRLRILAPAAILPSIPTLPFAATVVSHYNVARHQTVRRQLLL